MVMELFQVLDQIVDSLGIKKLYHQRWSLVFWGIAYFSYHLRWLSIVYSFKILLHGSVIILLLVQVVAKLPQDDVLLGRI
jgi:apolipoprotein N-acyltransferase